MAIASLTPIQTVVAADVDFNRDIRPILSKHCFACHGPDEQHREAGLRLDVRDAATRELESGATAVVPQNPDQSELLARVTSSDPDVRMPPPATGPALPADDVARLRDWIESGAPYAMHWSLVPPVRPQPPQVKSASWPRGAIDRFILARIEQAGLHPSPAADRRTLIRRLSLDLRGLPPTPAEVTEFVNDRAGGAYSRLVERFLADPAYGERLARLWLDLARYADSKGYGSDPLRTIWRYRDWVIGAFNRNLPFDQFTIEQLAGDLLPDATPDQLLATAFNRNTMTNTEGGTSDEEFRVEAVKDRVDTTMQVWMGLTMGCAKCHNHKYDPITQREYYQFFALYNQTADADRGDEAPTVLAPTAEMTEQIRLADARIADLQKRLNTPTPQLAAAQQAWEQSLAVAADWIVLEPSVLESREGAELKLLADGSVLASGTLNDDDAYTISGEVQLPEVSAVRLEVLPHASLPKNGSGRGADGGFLLSHFSLRAAAAAAVPARYVRIELPGKDRMLSLAEVQVLGETPKAKKDAPPNLAAGRSASQSSTFDEAAASRAVDGNTDGEFESGSTTHTNGEKNPWWEVDLGSAMPIERVVVWNRTDGNLGSRLSGCRVLLLDAQRQPLYERRIREAQPKVEINLLALADVPLEQPTADFSAKGFNIARVLDQEPSNKAGWKVEPQQDRPHAAVFTLAEPLAGKLKLEFRLDQRYRLPGRLLGHFRLSATGDPRARQRGSMPADVLAALDTGASERTIQQRETLTAYYRSIAPALARVRAELAAAEKSRPQPPAMPIMRELPEKERRESYVLVKGNFMIRGEKVEAGLPAVLPPWPPGAPHNRLGMARWLVDPSNPLTARVTVNRLWAQLFGRGLVETEEDFGSQGAPPSHPELLDWLASDLVSHGWDIKQFLRTVVHSAAYRQSARVTPKLLAADPQNRLYARGPRFRLEAEMVRDQALALSGLLSRKLNGPSVFPPQPAGLWQAAFNSERTWATSPGEDRYRRALYTFWRRTVPYPSLATFDAPSRELCTMRRIRTNTPLQALVTLNDPVYVEAAQALARRIVHEGGSNPEDRIRWALRLCLVREPEDEQVSRLAALYQSERQQFAADLRTATEVASDPLGPLAKDLEPAELAAWTVVAGVLLNLDGVLTKG